MRVGSQHPETVRDRSRDQLRLDDRTAIHLVGPLTILKIVHTNDTGSGQGPASIRTLDPDSNFHLGPRTVAGPEARKNELRAHPASGLQKIADLLDDHLFQSPPARQQLLLNFASSDIQP